MLNKTIVPFDQLWIPDTYLYNSETLEQKKTEAMSHAIIETGFWANDSLGARVQLMFPAIYKLSCAMNVQWFPYDSQNCTFIISSWTHDKASIDYWPTSQLVNLKNMARNDEWEVLGFEFERVEQYFKCCVNPWVLLYAHLIIRRKPLYYVINLVIPTSIITIVAITGFFTPTSTSSERDEKLYLGINTLLTMSIMMLMVCNQMPSTSTYVPLMSWYYMTIIMVIVLGTLMATIVLAIHGRKHHNRPLSRWVRELVNNHIVETYILGPPAALVELWHEFGVIEERRLSMSKLDPLLIQQLDPVSLCLTKKQSKLNSKP
ncbi:unnamed protein product [Strongylus vulgaris]|uniref:Neurotransmitter-gated ion-channel ligand-binding domain-containing protein n=1 Tax=Strongylus vulgaris TaxID=40348 RepID=A0A3P7JEA0_STRVU|nr:unnamed protein product [Strongylus vulgaris]